jgi:hypothetical protein
MRPGFLLRRSVRVARPGSAGVAPAGAVTQPRTREAWVTRPPPPRGAARKGWTWQGEREQRPALGAPKSPPESRKHGS